MPKLHVGTTGDYPPFSEYNDVLQCFTGFDVKLIEEFARSCNYDICYIRTTWPLLEAELELGNFDIAIGGVSFNKDREDKFLLSFPILNSEKVVLTHTSNRDKYQSINDINRHAVSVIYNPGGTNDKFVKYYLPLANQICEPEIENIFKRLSNMDVDVMITDKQEALYRSSVNKDLCCIKLDEIATQTKFGFLISNKCSVLQQNLNEWLASYLKTDKFEKLKIESDLC